MQQHIPLREEVKKWSVGEKYHLYVKGTQARMGPRTRMGGGGGRVGERVSP